jgi:phosphoribosylformimino-5-aminoimidazole carboxamide ribotide isomerase
VGQYALKITFDDGHDTGLYTWEYLHELGKRQDAMWRDYLEKLEATGASRDPATSK